MILPETFDRNKWRDFSILLHGIISPDASPSARSRGKNPDGEVVHLGVFILISLSDFFLMFFLFKAKAKEKKEQKAGERDDTIPPEYRLTPELVSFSCLHCFVGRALCLTLFLHYREGKNMGANT